MMSFFIQHGYGKSDKIQELASAGSLAGVVLSPADEDQASLRATVSMCKELGLETLLDPQTYVYSLSPVGSGKKHENHGLSFGPIHWSIGASDQQAIVDAIRAANANVGINGPYIAPSCLQAGFDDVWTSLSVNLARAAADRWGPEATIATLLLDESALGNWSAIGDWLDVATTLDLRGFYLIVNRRSKDYPPRTWDYIKLANLLRIIYILSELNEYEIYFGYADIVGQLGIAVGATAAASGWHYGLRSFNQQKWQPQPAGGRAPAPRYFAGKLWTSLRAEPETDALLRLSLRDKIFRSGFVDYYDSSGLSDWTRSDAQIQHLALLAERNAKIAGLTTATERVELVMKSLESAERLFAEIATTGAVLPPDYRSQVATYRRAIDHLNDHESL